MPTAVEHNAHLFDVHSLMADGSVRPIDGDLSQARIGLLSQVKLDSIDKVVLTHARSSLIGLVPRDGSRGGGNAFLIGLLPAVAGI